MSSWIKFRWSAVIDQTWSLVVTLLCIWSSRCSSIWMQMRDRVWDCRMMIKYWLGCLIFLWFCVVVFFHQSIILILVRFSLKFHPPMSNGNTLFLSYDNIAYSMKIKFLISLSFECTVVILFFSSLLFSLQSSVSNWRTSLLSDLMTDFTFFSSCREAIRLLVLLLLLRCRPFFTFPLLRVKHSSSFLVNVCVCNSLSILTSFSFLWSICLWMSSRPIDIRWLKNIFLGKKRWA